MEKIKLGFVQHKCTSDVNANWLKVSSLITDLASSGANVIVTQELFLSEYFCHESNPDSFELANEIPGNETDRLCELAKEKNIVIIASLFEKRSKGIYHNTAVVIDSDGKLLGKYRKNHIPDDPGYSEKYYFTPGDLGYPVFETAFGKIGVLICFDQWFPEAARLIALAGAELIVYPTAIGWNVKDDDDTKQEELHAWKTIQKSHAIANGVYIAAINRVGKEKNTQFWGHSFVANPMGTEILSLGTEEDNAVVEIDFSEIEKYRRVWTFLRDRRIDSYQSISKRVLDE